MKEVYDYVRNVVVRDHKPYCLAHDEPLQGTMNEQYDAYYCGSCNRWLESGCDGSKKDWDNPEHNANGYLISNGCPFDCINRPSKPFYNIDIPEEC